ncbi:bifunctional cobalt-precorrin-7 (C(5))-methyltransferase/cobalt-precorrin-6B (C(15))-methyltransferase [Thalassospira sp. TSL5-1]|uniref:bifunctional cobalt-precorrin-7 (C(5))-methyltransferase/cobalt-precorrin-6B (C(15))-methyltransferase n=1 Tax=Thalassospira sp. TSL5-1 TaxID=1544451 RepID=UPI00093A579D|nr:bifunctional cobalt-precorrin-7 (C(5))-methyltransferase/cobalt-precorrin-6B (C(15))-methyltransferase [Thalassospira sp. TSL5-1]OKH87255.1 precorrin-6Y C5,15-methyltransferase [Thalassospira sp. TSL5-1]
MPANNTTPHGKITVIGIGEDGFAGLSPAAAGEIKQAKVIFGGKRHLAMLPGDIAGQQKAWISPFHDNMAEIAKYQGQNPVILASGDPMFFGVGNTLIGHFGPENISVFPAPSSISLACARTGWALAECDVITLHGRKPENLRAHLRPRGRIIALSHDGSTPALVAVMLYEAGYGDSKLTVCERLGGEHEKITTQTAREWQHDALTRLDGSVIDPLNVILIDLVADQKASILPLGPGLPDDAFIHDGMITKSDIRAQTLASLGVWKGALLWDLGAGCGSISIEWMRLGGQAVAIEQDGNRCDMIRKNATRLGTPDLILHHTSILQALEAATVKNNAEPGHFPIPDAIFIGGGITTPELMEKCWDLLPVHGRLVANTVTLEGEQELFRFYNKIGGTLSRLTVSRLAPRGSFTGWHSLAPVTHYVGVKS